MVDNSQVSADGSGDSQATVAAAVSHPATGVDRPKSPGGSRSTDSADEQKRKMNLDTRLLIVAQVLTLLTLIALLIQTLVSQQSFKLSASAAELSFNLDVMIRNQDVNFKAAEDTGCRDYVWGPEVDKPPAIGSKAEQCGDAILDVLSMANAAVRQMPGFSRNRQDWSIYTTYVMQKSPNLKNRVLTQQGWWPELEEYANR